MHVSIASCSASAVQPRAAMNQPQTMIEPPPDGYDPTSPEAAKAMAPFSAGFVGAIAGAIAGGADGVAGGVAGALALGAVGATSATLVNAYRDMKDARPDYKKGAITGAVIGGALGAVVGSVTSSPWAAVGLALVGAAGAGMGTFIAVSS